MTQFQKRAVEVTHDNWLCLTVVIWVIAAKNPRVSCEQNCVVTLIGSCAGKINGWGVSSTITLSVPQLDAFMNSGVAEIS